MHIIIIVYAIIVHGVTRPKKKAWHRGLEDFEKYGTGNHFKRPNAQLPRPSHVTAFSLLPPHCGIGAKVQDITAITLTAAESPTHPLRPSNNSQGEARTPQSRASLPDPKKLLSDEKGSKKLLVDCGFSLTEPSRDDLTDSNSLRSCFTSCFNFPCRLSRSV